jgi:preprotein translocase subunit SecE
MAGETRRQRRDARRAAGAEAGAPQRGRPRPATAGGVPAEPLETPVAHRERRRRGTFIRECIAELRKVEWPGRGQVVQGTIVVIIACAIVGAYLYGADQVLRRVVQDVFL